MARRMLHLRLMRVAALGLLVTVVVSGQQKVPQGEWRRAGSDGGNTRYSPLDQINADNVRNLKIAWTWRSDNYGSQPEIKNETTPVMVNGVLYRSEERRVGKECRSRWSPYH